MAKSRIVQVLALAVTATMSAQSFAAPPPSVMGTWNAVLNNTNARITIASQVGPAPCPTIQGTIVETLSGAISNLRGFYCPTTGRIVFVRNSRATNDTSQIYSGSLNSVPAPDGFTKMAGTFADISSGNGEWGFFAAK
jgi:hypothetical protein